MGSQRVGHGWVTDTHKEDCQYVRRTIKGNNLENGDSLCCTPESYRIPYISYASNHKVMTNLLTFLPFKIAPISKTKLEWIWDLSPAPLLGTLQINPHFDSYTCCQCWASTSWAHEPCSITRGPPGWQLQVLEYQRQRGSWKGAGLGISKLISWVLRVSMRLELLSLPLRGSTVGFRESGRSR